ncbi:MAG TPA: ABC transporter permease, partial [Candidatus Saccharimonadales bacterium]|nr:ABC transporter permease [Candidatus Saccharimonadales bacterium]
MGFWHKKKETELDEEVRSHLRLSAQERSERGQEAGAAAQAARREFGNVELVKETARDSWRGRWLMDFLEDLRYGLRMLRKNPGFTSIAILTLTLGIGANSALFSVVNAVLLNPLPYPQSEQLVTVHESKPNFESGSISFPNFLDWQKENRSFTAMGASRPFGFSLTGMGEAEQVSARFITSDFFAVLEVNPILGRTFAKGEDLVGAAPITMISAGLWRRKFSASPEAIGKSLTLGGKSYTIVGIVPANFDLYLRAANQAEVYVPMGQWANPILMRRDAGLGIHGIARLKPGVTIEQARADMARITDSLANAYPKEDKGIGASLIPLRKSVLGDVQPILLMLLAAVGFVLLIACVNVANLLLARSTARTREFAIRAALGAGRQRIVRQLLTESVLLSLCGGVLGLLLAQFGTRAALGILPVDLPRSSSIQLDTTVLLFTLGLSLLAGILFGLVPAVKTSHLGLHTALKESSRTSSGSHKRAQGVLVVLEMAMALVLLVGAGLTIRSLTLLWKIDPGFRPDNVMTFNLAFPHTMNDKSPEAIRSIIRDVDRHFASIPGVDGVSQTWGAIPIGSED